MKTSRRSIWLWVRRSVITVATLAAVFVGVVGFAHTKAGRPLLRYLPGMGAKCPVGMDANLSLHERDRLRETTLASVRGTERAASRPALGFVLDETKESDVLAWAAKDGVRCEQRKSGAQLRCHDVPASALGATTAAEDVLFLFDADHALVGVDVTRRSLAADDAATLAADLSSHLERTVGAATSTQGERTGAFLGRGALNQISAEFRFVDYRAQVIATNLGLGRIVVREHYQSLMSGS